MTCVQNLSTRVQLQYAHTVVHYKTLGLCIHKTFQIIPFCTEYEESNVIS